VSTRQDSFVAIKAPGTRADGIVGTRRPAAGAGEFVVAAPDVPDEGVPSDHDSRAEVGLESAHRAQPSLQLAVVGLEAVVGVPLRAVPRRWRHTSSTFGCTAVMSVMTLVSVTSLSRWRVRRTAERAAASRRGETNTSMTCPNWSIAR
jgi:hypothetical protein